MIAFPNAKINAGLRIIEKLPSGYHSLKSLMIPTKFCDILEFVPSDKDEFVTSGIPVPGKKEENIVLKTLFLLRQHFQIPALKIHLHKVIPMGAGLGGGSADAAFFLKTINDFFSLGMDTDQQEAMIAKIGSDCSFFIRNKPAIISGTGDKISVYPLHIENYYLAIAYPGFAISTAEAYAGITPGKEEIPLREVIDKGIKNWDAILKNDFEESLFPRYPQLKEIKEEFYSNGAVYASMSGSGSSIYGIYEKKPEFTSRLKKFIVYDGLVEVED
jgi:4-diphosphocytidyl-2-C-methyl-D-erythritol kinase